MKNLLLLLSIFFVLGAISCATQQSQALDSPEQSVQDRRLANQGNLSLADVLRKNTSLTVTGQGNGVRVLVRGTSTMGQHGQHTQPLYVIDGVSVGNDYASVNRRIVPDDISRVEVLAGLSEVSVYGELGNHGVIKITTKSSKR